MAVQFLFQVDFNGGDLPEALAEFWKDRKAGPKIKTFMEELVRGVLDNKINLDEKLQHYATNWDVKRMGAVDRNVMRVALFEMMHREDIPPIVSINEAVDIAKELSTDESGKFVNGILDRARQDMDRPARAAKLGK
jgi:N utilization substance protein B